MFSLNNCFPLDFMQCTEEPLSFLDFYFIFFLHACHICVLQFFGFCIFLILLLFARIFYLYVFMLYLFLLQLNIFVYKRSHRGVSLIVVDALLYTSLIFIILPSVSISLRGMEIL